MIVRISEPSVTFWNEVTWKFCWIEELGVRIIKEICLGPQWHSASSAHGKLVEGCALEWYFPEIPRGCSDALLLAAF